ncbi:MAG TPA: fumarylacetoacetate hydrolase family protein, partial [Alphaproteobacteria bacterium]|nr:fumarylacetoacetate hydrolase family protein [Alphaproteobacteria bacterium]
VGSAVMGHPFESLAFLANSLVRRGRPLAAGQIVLTGSIVATKWLKPGDHMATVIDGLGEARLSVL